MPKTELSLREARQIALVAQGLAGRRPRSPEAMLEQLGAVQLDTISVLARSHLLVAWSRLGAFERERIEAAYWSQPLPSTFEYWAHAACIIPIERWPSFAFRRRARRERGRRWHRLEEPERHITEIRRRLTIDGPLMASELGGAKKGGPWWDWTEEKIAVEWMLDTGEVVCVERRGFRRVYDLAERAIPAELYALDPDDRTCLQTLVGDAARALGVATLRDLARHHQLTLASVRGVIGDLDLVQVAVRGSATPWYATPASLEAASGSARARPVLLSPFDCLVWDRERSEHLFGFVHRLEAYVPKAERRHGYYAMPILSGTNLIGTVDPGRVRDLFVAKHVVLEDAAAVGPSARALVEAAGWVGARAVRVEAVTPEALRAPLVAALGASAVGEETA